MDGEAVPALAETSAGSRAAGTLAEALQAQLVVLLGVFCGVKGWIPGGASYSRQVLEGLDVDIS
jgi:hypothetical protein